MAYSKYNLVATLTILYENSVVGDVLMNSATAWKQLRKKLMLSRRKINRIYTGVGYDDAVH
jgi:hypothetical protein